MRNFMNSLRDEREEKRGQGHKNRESALREFQPQLRKDFIQATGREIGRDLRDPIGGDKEFQVPVRERDLPFCGGNDGQRRQNQVSRLRPGHGGEEEHPPTTLRQALFI